MPTRSDQIWEALAQKDVIPPVACPLCQQDPVWSLEEQRIPDALVGERPEILLICGVCGFTLHFDAQTLGV